MATSKKRILIGIVGQGGIQHIIRSGLLYKIKEFCEPVVAFTWHQADLFEELEKNGIEAHILPPCDLSNDYKFLRAKINRWYKAKVLKSHSSAIQKKYASQFLTWKKKLRRAKTEWPENVKMFVDKHYGSKLIVKETELITTEKIYDIYEAWLKQLNVQGFYTVTPFYLENELIARILRKNNLPILASIHSFDNVTKRDWPAMYFDHYIVWNKYNKAELFRINPNFKTADISIAGAPQFDHHFRLNFVQEKNSWLQKFNIPTDKKIILFGGGPVTLFPNEPQYLKHLNDAIHQGMIKDAVILFRCHPLDRVGRWKEYVGESSHIIYSGSPNGSEKLDHSNISLSDINNLIASLKYTDVHINLCSTMTVDGSIFNKPQIGPYYDDVKTKQQHLLRSMYQQEHFLPILKAGAVHFAHSKPQLIEIVNDCLNNPDKNNTNCKNCVEEIITYTDGNSTNRVSKILEQLILT